MKLIDLLEMPEDIGEDMRVAEIGEEFRQIRLPAIQQDYKVLRRLNENGTTVWFVIKNDQSMALAGIVQGQSFFTQIVLYFHHQPELGEAGGNALQVDLVQGKESRQGTSYGSKLYQTIISSGYTIVSDSAQYNGGKALWRKIVRMSMDEGYSVLIMKHGKFMRDTNGQPILYNGKNIPDDQIWGPPGSQEHAATLLVARK